MNWFYLVFLDSKGVTTGPHPAPLILSKYHFKTGEITALTKIWNVGRGVKQWTELKNVYSLLVDDIVGSIPRGAITKRLLFTMMNPYHIYIYKTKQYPHNSFPVGQAKVNIEYKAYLANLLEHESHAKPLKHFLQNRESVVLGAKKNPFGLDMALFKIREGEQCSVYIPWRLAYGDKGAMNLIPPKTDILFVVTLHKIEKQGTTWQHNKIRLDKWSKMRAKWNAQKASTNTLHITDNYPMPSIQNKPNTPIHNTTNNNMNQAILPIQMKPKPGKPAPRINMQAEAMQKHRSIEDQWKELDHSPHSQPNTPIVVNAQQTFKKPEPASKKRGGKRPSKKLQVNTIHMYSDQFNIPPPPVRKHQSSQSENVAMEEIAAQINAQQSSHQRQMTSYTPTPSKSSEQVRPTLMLSFTQAKEAACAPALMTLTEEEKLPEQEPMFNNNSQSWNSTIVHNPSNENNGGITNDQLRVVRSRKRTQSAMDFGQWLTDNKIPDAMVQKLMDEGIVSWDELNAIEDDIDLVATELGLSALHKIKLKALVRKVSKNAIPEPTYTTKSPSKIQEEPQPVVPEPEPEILYNAEPVPVAGVEPQAAPDPEADPDDARYLKSQIKFLKAENFELKQLSDANECKQQVIEMQNALYAKDVELQGFEKQYTNYSNSVHQLIEQILSSSSRLDKKALDAIESMKQSTSNNQKKDLKALIPGILNDKVLYLGTDDINDVIKERKSVHVALNSTMDTWLSHVNTQKAIFEHQLSAIIANKYNQIFYKHFVQQMALVFYDAKLIRSQFVQEMNGAVLRKDGEKVLFDVPLTVHLLSVIRNKGSAKDMVYDILCLDHFTRNMLEFEADVTYNDALRFCCLIAIHLCKSKVVQNMIKLSKQSGRDIQQITHNLKQKATLLTENLMCLIATGYALLIVNVAQRNNNYEWDVCIECLANLCLSHPMLANANRRTIAADQVKQAVNKESLNMILMAIATDELKQVISDYFNHFGTVEFIDKIIDASRLHNDTL
eukprot:46938_1